MRRTTSAFSKLISNVICSLDNMTDGRLSSCAEVDATRRLTGNVLATVWKKNSRRFAIRFEPKGGLLVIRVLRCCGPDRAIYRRELTLDSVFLSSKANKGVAFAVAMELHDKVA